MRRKFVKFSDESDRASALEEMERENALARVRSSMGRSLKPVGRCYFCDDDNLPANHIFCDNDCRDMWQRERDAHARNGR